MKKSKRRPYECKDCEGSGVIQSANGDSTIECPKCQRGKELIIHTSTTNLSLN